MALNFVPTSRLKLVFGRRYEIHTLEPPIRLWLSQLDLVRVEPRVGEADSLK